MTRLHHLAAGDEWLLERDRAHGPAARHVAVQLAAFLRGGFDEVISARHDRHS